MAQDGEAAGVNVPRDSDAESTAGGGNEATEHAMLYCPVCNERLVESRCKLVCQRCGYFMSCADYY